MSADFFSRKQQASFVVQHDGRSYSVTESRQKSDTFIVLWTYTVTESSGVTLGSFSFDEDYEKNPSRVHAWICQLPDQVLQEKIEAAASARRL